MPKKENVGTFVWRLVYPILIFVGVEMAIEMAALYIHMFRIAASRGMSLMDVNALEEELTNYTYNISMYITIARSAVLIPLYIMFMRRDKGRSMINGSYTKYEKLSPKWFLLLPVVGFFAAMGFNHVVPMVLMAVQGFIQVVGRSFFGVDWNVDFFGTYDNVSEMIYSGGIAVQIISTAVAAPIVEEFLFRGLIYNRLRERMKFVPAALVSSLVFGALHGNAVQFLYAFIIGLLLAFVYEKFKTILAPVIFHAGANLISVIITNIMPEEGIGLTTGGYMLLVVAELAVTLLILWLIDRKVIRKPVAADGTDGSR